jgi:hypothetical protein
LKKRKTKLIKRITKLITLGQILLGMISPEIITIKIPIAIIISGAINPILESVHSILSEIVDISGVDSTE